MVDRQEVLKGLKEIEDEAYCRWVHRPYVPDKLVTLFGKYLPSIVALLKEQEPQEPFYCEADDSWGCGNCGETVGYGEFNPGGIDPVKNKYCPNCGRAVKWDA